MPGPLAALAPYIITAAATVGSQLLSNRANRRMSKFAYKKDREMWERQNEYNSPEQQQQRIKGAGLNPALMYGQGTVGNATQLPQYNVPQQSYQFTDSMNPLEMLGTYQDLKQKASNIELTDEQIKTEAVRQTLVNAQGVVTGQEARIKALQADLLSNTWDSDLQAKLAQNIYTIANSQIQQWRSKMINKYNITPEGAVWLRGTISVLELLGFDDNKLKPLMDFMK